jgi:hypothetical protein
MIERSIVLALDSCESEADHCVVNNGAPRLRHPPYNAELNTKLIVIPANQAGICDPHGGELSQTTCCGRSSEVRNFRRYCTVPKKFFTMKLPKEIQALSERGGVSLLDGHTRIDLVHGCGERVFNALNGQVLPDRLELVGNELQFIWVTV